MTFDFRDFTGKQRLFAEEYVLCLNPSEAARKAGYAGEGSYGTEIMKIPHVKAYIDHLTDQRAERLKGIQDQVVEKLWEIASVDANELVQYRRTCCRFCYGEDHRYQWTDVEFERACLEAKNRGFPQPEAPGGNGYDHSKDPNPDCPECKGEGDGRVFAQDTRKLSQAAKTAYAGAKVGRDGLEIKIHDRVRALEMLGKHFGLFKDRVEHSGKVENTGPVLNLVLSGDQAAKAVAAANKLNSPEDPDAVPPGEGDDA